MLRLWQERLNLDEAGFHLVLEYLLNVYELIKNCGYLCLHQISDLDVDYNMACGTNVRKHKPPFIGKGSCSNMAAVPHQVCRPCLQNTVLPWLALDYIPLSIGLISMLSTRTKNDLYIIAIKEHGYCMLGCS